MNKDLMQTGLYFSTPIYVIEKPEWLNNAINVTDNFVSDVDYGASYHSSPLYGLSELKELETYIGATANNLLDEWGYDMSKYKIFFTEFWVQEFSKNGGGHHNTHVHWDNHISGFYFLKCSDKTSFPVFHDPRHGAMMTKLPQKSDKINLMSDSIHIKPNPGTLIFFPSYLPHEFVLDKGIDDFRFIHFNLQAVRNDILNSVKGVK